METARACDVMTKNVIKAKPEMLLTEVMDLLLRWSISGMPVVDDDGKLVGIISEIDLVNLAFSGNAADTCVSEIMTKNVISYGPDADIGELVQCFSAKRLRRVPIVEADTVVGVVSRRDIVRYISQHYDRY